MTYDSKDLRKDFESNKDEPIVLSAESVEYDQSKDIFKAFGRVTLQQKGHVLSTKTIQYDKKRNLFIVENPFSLYDCQGDVIFGKSAVFKTMDEGTIDQIRLLTRTRERIAAKIVRKKSDKTQEFDMVSYTPCERCKDQLDPIWSLHARRIVRDEKDQTMTYTDAYLKFWNVPVFYFPHFYMPMKRTSGFLMPYLSQTRELGVFVGTPYYWVMNDSGNNDLTLTPFLTGHGGFILSECYRHHLNDGVFSLKSAINTTHAQYYRKTKIPPTRGYFNSLFQYDFSPNWRVRSDEIWVSDRTFLSTRPFFGNTTSAILKSETSVDGFYERHFAQIRGIRYQGLQEHSVSQTLPYIYPQAFYNYLNPDLPWGSFGSIDIQTLSLYEKVGIQMQRGLTSGVWSIPLVTPWGQQIQPFAYVQGALYQCKPNKDPFHRWTNTQEIYSKQTVTRLYPQTGLETRWPILMGGNNPSFILTPIVQGIMGAFHVNSPRIPDQDSLGVNFTDSVLFERNRFPGNDRVDDGARMNYALLMQGFFKNGQVGELFLGQSQSFSMPPIELVPFGVSKGASDYVGRIQMTFQNPFVNIRYRFRLSQKNLSVRFQEIAAVFGPPLLRISGGYIYMLPLPLPPKHYGNPSLEEALSIQRYHQGFINISSQFLRHWSTKVFLVENFKLKGQRQKALDRGIGIEYKDECFAFTISARHSFYRQQDLKPGISVDFSIHLHNLGGVRHKFDRFMRGNFMRVNDPTSELISPKISDQ